MKKIISLILITAMLLTILPITVSATEELATITVYVTISKYGEFEKTASKDNTVFLPVELSNKSIYTLDDLFKKAHELYYAGEDGYSSNVGDYGAYITKFWGDESGNFGYQINGGTVTATGLNQELQNNDYVDVVIYKNLFPDTETYTKFDKLRAEVDTGEDFHITLSQAEYDENWNMVFSACEGANILIDGNDTEIITNSNGIATIKFKETGTYIISAYKSKTVNDETVPAITVPVCEVTVKEPDYLTIINNIAEKYSDYSLSSNENMVWLIADMAIYNELFPESENIVTDKVKQTCLDKIIADAYDTTSASALAKYILALRAMGYDAKNVYNSKSRNFDIVSKLTTLVDEQDNTTTNIYTLPYVIIALSQAEGYITEEQMNYLINSAISCKDSWQNNEWGTDAATAMLLALAPYYNTNDEIKNTIDETIPIIISAQSESGLIGNAASTGIAITALSALGIDVQTVVCNENSLVDGLMTQATGNLDGFEPMENSFSTEQGFRGLLAWQLFLKNPDRIMYDFSSYPMNEARSTKKTSSGSSSGGGNRKPIVNEPVDEPEEEVKEEIIEETNKVSDNKNPDVKIMPIVSPEKTFADIAEHKSKNEIEALAKRNIINGKNESTFDPDTTMTRAEFATIISRGLGLPEKNDSIFKDITNSDWFYTYINTSYHYGIVKGVSETEFNPNGVITRQEAAVMLARAAKLCGMETKMNSSETKDILAAFTDYIQIESWAIDSMAFCYNNNIISDESIEILPVHEITRAEVATMVYNMLDKSALLQEATE